jgi:uncharacterized membrane protein
MAKKSKYRPPYLFRLVRAWPRLFTSALIGMIVAGLTPSAWQLATRILTGWDVGVGLYLVLVYILIAKSESRHIAERAASQDEGRITILILTVASALATIGAIIFELTSSHGADQQITHLLLAIATILSSWFFIHTIFAVHYAHEYYGEHGGTKKSGLKFPGDEDPDYWDFVYFSFVVGMTAQVSDVAVTSKSIRQTVTAHSIVSFLFNVSLLALTINIAANVI